MKTYAESERAYKAALTKRIQSGAELSSAMRPIRTRQQVAEIIGISYQAVAIIEKLVLRKVAMRMKQATAHSE